MAKKEKPKNEEELRKKVRQKLEQKFREKQERVRGKQAVGAKTEQPRPVDDNLQDLEEQAVHSLLEEEIASRHPEFIKCVNHLSEIRWLTPSELAEDFEFYPVEESRWSRFKQKYFAHKIKDPALLSGMAKMRPQVEDEIKRRLQDYRQKRSQNALSGSNNELENQIYQEEIDRFYRKKKGYKKYKNHLGESRWMTLEEFNNQDEFFEEMLSPKQIFIRRSLVFLAIILLAGLVWYLAGLQRNGEMDKAYLIVKVKQNRGLLYIDKNLAIGFSNDKPYPISAGEHEISLISNGYTTLPKAQIINLSAGDTARLSFQFVKKQLSESGVVNIHSPFASSEIILDGEFQGTLDRSNTLILPPGDHTLSVEKDGYICRPPQRIFKLKAGDTLNLSFAMRPLKTRRSRKSDDKLLNMGLLEVRSNVKEADIYLDGQKTDFQTDYILQRIPFGQHIIRVGKKGYKVYPNERVIRLDKKHKRASVDFTLSSTIRRVTITTVPVKGSIAIDGKAIGEGQVKVPIPLGEHKIDFGPVAHYSKPALKIFKVTEDSPDQLIFKYTLNFSIIFSVGGVQPNSEAGSVNSGYLLNDDRFHSSGQAGPEIRRMKKGGLKYWNLGYAFQYRNPPGRDALVFNFYIPENIDLSEPIYLKIWAYQTKDFYPLVIKGNSYYRIDLNQTRFRRQVKPYYSVAQVDQDHFDRFQINDHLHPGFNRLLIAATKYTTAHVMIWKVAVE